MASMAPRSIPAGLSQEIQSNLVRRSARMLPTPSSVRASLSLVWDAGSNHKFSRRLSRMRACESFATPCTTLMKSNTTRRSAPRTRSRLRKPTSKSTTTTFSPIWASAAPSAAVEVVLPTPPLPDVTTKTLVILFSSSPLIQRCDFHDVAFEPHLSWLIAQGGVNFFSSLIMTVDRQQLCLDFLTVNASGRVAISARHRATAKRSVDMDGAACNNFGARTDRTQDRYVALGKNRLARTHRAFEQQRHWFRFGLRLLRLVLRKYTMASAYEQRWHTRSKAGTIHALDAKHTNIPLFEACDEVHDGRLAKVHGGKVKHHRLADKKAGRLAEWCAYFVKPGNDRNRWAKYERNVRSPSHANQLTCRPRNCLHEDRLALLFEWLRKGGRC